MSMSDRAPDQSDWRRYVFSDLTLDGEETPPSPDSLDPEESLAESAQAPDDASTTAAVVDDPAPGYTDGHAAGHTEGYQAGYKAGYEAAYEAGLAEARAQGEREVSERMASAERFVETLEVQAGSLSQSLATSLTELALETGYRLAGAALTLDSDKLIADVEALLLAHPDLTGRTHLCVSESDHTTIEHALGAKVREAGWIVRVDQEMVAGDCRLDNEQIAIESTLEDRFARLQTLVKG